MVIYSFSKIRNRGEMSDSSLIVGQRIEKIFGELAEFCQKSLRQLAEGSGKIRICFSTLVLYDPESLE
jgi:hypothetical protein